MLTIIGFCSGIFIMLLGISILKISCKKVDAKESPEAMYERATRWQQQIIELDDMVERVREDEKWCQYVKNIKGRKNGLREV